MSDLEIRLWIILGISVKLYQLIRDRKLFK